MAKRISLSCAQDTLQVKIAPDQTKSDLLQGAYAELKRLDALNQLPGGLLLRIDGPCPLVVGYAIAAWVSPRYQVVAVHDPRLGGYIVVKTDSQNPNNPPLGTVVPLTQGSPKQTIKIVLCGPPHSGKSCLQYALKQQLMAAYDQQGSPYPWVFDVTPDGEGSWFQGTMQQAPAFAKALKQQYRGPFTDGFVQGMATSVANLTLPLTLIDLGGKLSDANLAIASGATHAIILWRDHKSAPEQEHPFYQPLGAWRQFCQNAALEVIAELKSHREAQTDQIDVAQPILRGNLYGLQRGNDLRSSLIVQALTQQICHLCKTQLAPENQ
ncbi:hypothetical protein [Picosynechococcus sp. NKBG042902]|uniref:hypothetical protein n=1 Tax=Picosynechococcus sp. NKBG042902 TaxID=490193 RepID=UPI00069470B5|nr:hypothetical protein [Picosynechococcus sp. NKBG042902]